MNILMIDENTLFYVSPTGLEKFPKIEGKESLNSRYLIKSWIDFYNNYNASLDLRLIPNFASLYHLVGRVLKTTGKFMRVDSQEEVLKILKKAEPEYFIGNIQCRYAPRPRKWGFI